MPPTASKSGGDKKKGGAADSSVDKLGDQSTYFKKCLWGNIFARYAQHPSYLRFVSSYWCVESAGFSFTSSNLSSNRSRTRSDDKKKDGLPSFFDGFSSAPAQMPLEVA